MYEMHKVLYVDPARADELQLVCSHVTDGLSKGEVVFDEEAVFLNGARMAIQVIAPNEPESEPCWTQGVLFDKTGNELGCTEVGSCFLGEYVVGSYHCWVKKKGA
jgi:hypothetical protein